MLNKAAGLLTSTRSRLAAPCLIATMGSARLWKNFDR